MPIIRRPTSLASRRRRWNLPGHFKISDGFLETLGRCRLLLYASRRQSRIIAPQGLVSALADDDATPTRNALQTAGQIDVPAKDGLIQNVIVGAHQAHGDSAGIDAGAQREQG
jgi:hypothetical protein